MRKDLAAKIREYTDKEGNVKGEYARVGVLLENENGEYILLDPSINIAGCLMKQNAMEVAKGKSARDALIVGVYSNEQQSQQPKQSEQGSNDFDDDIPF